MAIRETRSPVSVELVGWAELSPLEQTAVRGLSLSQHQVEFAGTVEMAIAQCESEPTDELVGLAVLSARTVVGFLVLKRASKAPSWVPAGAAIVSAMRIAAERQGSGLGTAALRLLPAWVLKHWPQSRTIVLSVDEENVAGMRAYAKAGWVDKGVRVAGRIGWVRHMSIQVAGS